MRYSTRTRYGLRFLINLAGRPAGSCVQLAEIAREEGVSVKYLEQIVRVLRPAGILRSARGAKGGYALAKSPDAIRMDEVRAFGRAHFSGGMPARGKKLRTGRRLPHKMVLAGAG